MAITIKNMEAPKSCDACQFYDDISRFCDAANRRLYKIDQPKPIWCPIKEVKHGRWLPDEWIDYEDGTSVLVVKCSLCGEQMGGLTEYCPYCGAKMGEDEDEEEV